MSTNVAPKFSYIVPIHNKEDVIGETMRGIFSCSASESEVITVIDGCTDGTEARIDEAALQCNRKVKKIYMPDVHMLKSVNAGLRSTKADFAIIMQDDIILQDQEFEKKIEDLYRRMGPSLGVVSLRLGANIRLEPVWRRLISPRRKIMIEEVEYIQSRCDNQSHQVAEMERFVPRMAAINGPNVIPVALRNAIGILDENLAPYGYDDPEYCLRALAAGFINGVFPLKYRSDEEWGGTRRSKKFRAEVDRIHLRNRHYIAKLHHKTILRFWGSRDLQS